MSYRLCFFYWNAHQFTNLNLFSGNECGKQLRNAYSKLEADLSNSRKRLAELIEQRDNLKKGREESVSILSFEQWWLRLLMLLVNDLNLGPLPFPFLYFLLNQLRSLSLL